MRYLAVVLGVLTALGCQFDPNSSSGKTDGSTGQVDAAVDGDGAVLDSDAGLPITARCGTPGVYIDSFSSSTPASFWLMRSPGSTKQLDGVLRVQPPANQPNQFAGYRSRQTVDLIGARALIQIDQMVNTNTQTRALFVLEHNEENRILIMQVQGNLVVQVLVNSLATQSAVVYSPTDHRFWQVRESGGNIYLEASADGTAFAELYSIPTPDFASAVHLAIGTSTDIPVSSAGEFHIASLNSGVGVATFCKAHTLVDDFDDNSIGIQWAHHGQTGTGCTPYETGGSAHFDQNGSPNSDCFYASGAGYDLTDSAVTARINTISNFHSNWVTYLALRDNQNRVAIFAFRNDQMCAGLSDSVGVAGMCMDYSDSQIFWRIRESGGTLSFETSSDLANWNTVHSETVPFALSAVEIAVGTRTIGPSTPIGLGVQFVNQL